MFSIKARCFGRGRCACLLFCCLLWAIGLTGSSPAFAQTLEVGCPETNSMIVIDGDENIIHRGDGGEKMALPVRDTPISDLVLILSSGSYDPNTGDVTLHLQFRVLDIELTDYVVGDDEAVRIEGVGVSWENLYLTITDSGTTGTGETFAEFAATINTNTGYRGLVYTLWLVGENPVRFSLYRLWEALEMSDVEREGGHIDHWFQIMQTTFPEACVEGAPTSAYSDYTMNTVPANNIEVAISGQNAIFEPTSATTDVEGMFGVAAFTDPASLNVVDGRETQSQSGGELLIEFQNSVRKRGLSGIYCEVIMVEGTVRVIGGRGTVKQGDILWPKTKLSLATGWGSRAQIALRFINGSHMQVIADVYTNACLADIIEIGNEGFVNQSAIQGETPLASISRTLCEKIAGFPSTPEQWAQSVGRLTVTTGVSLVVPGSGIVGFAIRYVVKDQTGQLYDRIMTSPKSNKFNESRTQSSGDPRAILDFYYDGSTRVASNIGIVPIYVDEVGILDPMAQVAPGQWLEMSETVGRLWNTPLNEIDGQGPLLRLGCEAYPETFRTKFEVTAFDLAGIDPTTFEAEVNGVTSTAFTTEDGKTWNAEFTGIPPGVGSLAFVLQDRAQNASVLEWSDLSMPGSPNLEEVRPACWDAGETTIRWANPVGMDPEDILYHEVQQIWRSNPLTWTVGPWISVGPVNETELEIPETVNLGTEFHVNVRTFDQSGCSGFQSRSEELAFDTDCADTFLMMIADWGSHEGDITDLVYFVNVISR